MLGMLMLIASAALYGPALRYELVDLDDLMYVSQNQIVLNGLAWPSIRMAFTTVWQGMWAPVLWLSYMLDIQLFGRMAWGLHLTNILLHALNAVLVFLLFHAWTKKPWRAFWAAAFWAWHPLRVESVAWVAERKDVLSGFFFLLCIGAYVLAWRPPRPDSGPPPRPRRFWIFSSAALLAMGLLVKPMLVTTPCVLLLLDFWPLNRIRLDVGAILRNLPKLILEKWAFWALSAAAAFMSVAAHAQVGAVNEMPLATRLKMVPLHYAFYLFKTVRPRNLTVLYEEMWFGRLEFLIALALLGGISLWVWLDRHEKQNEWVGWACFLGLFVPVIGIVRFGAQSLADRFSYLPAIGLSLALVNVCSPTSRRWRLAGAFCWGGILLWMAFLTRQQLPVWRNTTTLYENVRRYFPTHPHALYHRATLEFQRGDIATAHETFNTILRHNPALENAQFGKALAMDELGDSRGAADWLAAHPPPSGPSAYGGYWERHMGTFALRLGQPERALHQAQEALRRMPVNDNSRMDVILLAMAACLEMGDATGALTWARQWPPYRDISEIGLRDLMPYHLQLWARGRRLGAIEYFRRLLDAFPDDVELLNNLAWGMATADWSPMPPEEILGVARRALERGGQHPILLDTLGAALANAGDFGGALETSELALALLEQSQPEQGDLHRKIQSRMQGYAKGQPWREDAFSRLWMDRYVR